MISRKTMLLYNLGLAFTLVVCGLLTLHALQLLGHDPEVAAVRESITSAENELAADQNLDRLRSRAVFYLRMSDDLKRARYEDSRGTLAAVRYGCFLLAATFVLGALFALAAADPKDEKAKPKPAGANPGAVARR